MLNIFRKNKNLKVSKLTFSIFASFILLTSQPVFSEIVFPEYTGDNVIDLSGKFDNRYANSLESELTQSSNDVRIVFLNTKGKINLSFYAPKLFKKWNMKPDGILVVIDPYLNKTGYGLGQQVLNDMRKRQIGKENPNLKETENSKPIDYDNLATAIIDRFSPEQMKQEKDNKPNTKLPTTDASNSSGSSSANTRNNKRNNINIDPLEILIPLAIIAVIGGGAWYFYDKKKRIKELMETRSNYLFDLNIQKKEIISLIDEIYLDIEKMNLYEELAEEVENDIDQLILAKNKAELFLDETDAELEDMDIDHFELIKILIGKCPDVKIELNKAHDQSVDIRKTLDSILNKNSRDISYVRNEIEHCKSGLNKIKANYDLDLTLSEYKIKKSEKYLRKLKHLYLEDSHIEAIELAGQIRNSVHKITKDLEIIPNLYKQINEKIPLALEKSLSKGVYDIGGRYKAKQEIEQMKNIALNSLSSGDFEKSEKLVQDTFNRIKEIKNELKGSHI